MRQLEELKRGLEALGIKIREYTSYRAYGVRVHAVEWKGTNGIKYTAEQATYATLMYVKSSEIMSAEEAIATTIGDSMKVNYSLDEGAHAPVHNYREDAGTDLRCMEGVKVPAFGSVVIDTGTHVSIPLGYGGLLVSKSGLNIVHELTSTGLIDSGYTGSIKVRVYNLSDKEYVFEPGDKITQIVLVRIATPEWVQVDHVDGGARGDNGYGSTGA